MKSGDILVCVVTSQPVLWGLQVRSATCWRALPDSELKDTQIGAEGMEVSLYMEFRDRAPLN